MRRNPCSFDALFPHDVEDYSGDRMAFFGTREMERVLSLGELRLVAME